MNSKLFVYSGWAIVWTLALYYIYTNALRYFNPSYEIYTPDFKPYAPFIVIHVAGGMTALLIGPLQFFTSLRNNYPRLHRRIGRIYLTSIMFAGVAAVYLAIFDNIIRKKEFIFATGTMGMALAWFITAGMAFWAIKKKKISQHKEWMIRSYVLTSNFILFRLMFYGLLEIEDFQFKDDIGSVTAWASWSIPLLITEFILQARKIKNSIA